MSMLKTSVKLLCFAAVLLTGSSAYATVITYVGTLNGANESPANGSPGTGTALVSYNTVTQLLEVQVTFADLTGPNTAAHIHCCTITPFAGTAGVATVTPTFTGFPGGVTSGTYDHTFDLTLAFPEDLQPGIRNGPRGKCAGLRGGAVRGSCRWDCIPEHPYGPEPRGRNSQFPGRGTGAGHPRICGPRLGGFTGFRPLPPPFGLTCYPGGEGMA